MNLITIANSENEYLTALKQSAEKHGCMLHIIQTDWKGFGTKVIELRKFLLTVTFDHFIFVDAYDTLIVSKPNYNGKDIIFSCEKHKWPDRDAPYKETEHVWQYLNSGSFAAPVAEYLALTDKYPIDYADDDQRYYTQIFLQGGIKLDYECKLFQSMAFEEPGDFSLTPFKNNITNSTPSILHFNGKCHNKALYNMNKFDSIKSVKDYWKDTPEIHKEIHEGFIELVNAMPELKAHRDFVESNIHGFGERSFLWMWWLIVLDMPKEFTFLEIGVFKGQTLSLVELIAKMQGKSAKRYGVTPLSTEGGVWESDYKADIETIHRVFDLPNNYELLVGLSEDEGIIKKAGKLKLDILYIDGGHEYRHIKSDFENYSHLVKTNGLLVVDDCANNFKMPFGYFQGIETVTRYIDEVLPPLAGSSDWEFEFSVVHNRVFRRK